MYICYDVLGTPYGTQKDPWILKPRSQYWNNSLT